MENERDLQSVYRTNEFSQTASQERTLFAHAHLTAMRAHTVRPYGITDADELPNSFTQMKPSR